MDATPERQPFYSPGMRAVQDHFDGRRLADRLEQVTVHPTFSSHDQAFIANATMVFLATADAEGWPDSSYKGGRAGFVRIVSDSELAMAVYDGNSQYRSLGNISVNPRVGLLFIDFDKPDRLRVNGTAAVVMPEHDTNMVASFPGAIAVIKVSAQHIFPNCGRYVHDVAHAVPSVYAPDYGYTPPAPEWKSMDLFADVLPQART